MSGMESQRASGSSVWTILRVTIKAFAILVLAYLIIPTLFIVPLSFSADSYLSFPPTGYSWRWYEAFTGSTEYQYAIWNSLQIGLPSAFIASVFGTLAALGLARGKMPGKKFIAILMVAPIVLPQIVLALGLYPLMAKINLVGTMPAVILAHAVVSMPLVFISVSAALRACPEQLEHAAAVMGANGWRTFWQVTFPLARPGIIVGFIFAFTFSFDELVLAMFLTSPTTRTMPLLLWQQLNFEMTPIITAASVALLIITLLLLSIAAWVNRHNLSEAGRKITK